MSGLRLPAGRRGRDLDVLAGAWVVLWVVIGIVTFAQIRDLGANAETVIRVGEAVQETGRGLGLVGGLPLVGGRVGELAGEVEQAGARAAESGRDNLGAARRLSVTLGLAVAIIPSVPLLAVYLPARLAGRREREDLLALLGSGMAPAAIDRALADRALRALPYRDLLALGDPWADFAAGRHERLARAELARHGLDRDA